MFVYNHEEISGYAGASVYEPQSGPVTRPLSYRYLSGYIVNKNIVTHLFGIV